MKALERLILLIGLGTIAYLVWLFDPRQIWTMVSQVGLVGFLLILSFQIFDHLLNALGWKLAFTPEYADQAPLWTLIKVRIAGDGVNYLTPSGQIAGELIRPAMLPAALPEDVKNGSVVVAKFSQAMAQALFILVGMASVLQGRLNFLRGRQSAAAAGGSLLIFGLVGVGLWILTTETAPPAFLGKFGRHEALAGLRAQVRGYLLRHPARYAGSVLFFMSGYLWGAFECLLICHFMKIPMPFITAVAMEILSNVVDSLMFMVPAKIGSQEAGKTAIFHGLGYPGPVGLAFGLIRHVREVLWASAGFALYAVNRRRTPAHVSARSPSAPVPPSRAG